MVIQSNLSALNTFNNLNLTASQLRIATERLSSGFRINRAADDAAGLVVSEKMRSQIRGLNQAARNARSGMDMLSVAEGGLNETQAILHRLRELSVKSANATYQDDVDRQAIQLEVNALVGEIDKIASSTEFNKIKLLDGSLSGGRVGGSSEYGARFGIRQHIPELGQHISIASNVLGVTVAFTTGASGQGGENAIVDTTGRHVTINLHEGESYSDLQINELIKNAVREGGGVQNNVPATIEFKSDGGQVIAANFTTTPTVSGLRQRAEMDLLPLKNPGGYDGHADQIRFVANQYGSHTNTSGVFSSIKISVQPGTNVGDERVEINTHAVMGQSGAEITLHLATGEYTGEAIERLLRGAGFDYKVEMWSNVSQGDYSSVFFTEMGAVSMDPLSFTDGRGLGRSHSTSGHGLVLQIGPNNAAEQRMSVNINAMDSASIGLSGIDVRTADDARNSIEMIDKAAGVVSLERASLGVMNNRLEHTVNNLTSTAENLRASESRIRDADMAAEIIRFAKQRVLQKVGTAMLAQTVQKQEEVMQLLAFYSR
jgi:flagellin